MGAVARHVGGVGEGLSESKLITFLSSSVMGKRERSYQWKFATENPVVCVQTYIHCTRVLVLNRLCLTTSISTK